MIEITNATMKGKSIAEAVEEVAELASKCSGEVRASVVRNAYVTVKLRVWELEDKLPKIVPTEIFEEEVSNIGELLAEITRARKGEVEFIVEENSSTYSIVISGKLSCGKEKAKIFLSYFFEHPSQILEIVGKLENSRIKTSYIIEYYITSIKIMSD